MGKLFGKQLREERKKQNLTIPAVSKACGTSEGYITLMESGKRLPDIKVIPNLAMALEIKPNIVLNWYLEDLRDKLSD